MISSSTLSVFFTESSLHTSFHRYSITATERGTKPPLLKQVEHKGVAVISKFDSSSSKHQMNVMLPEAQTVIRSVLMCMLIPHTSHRLYLKDGWWSFRSCILSGCRSRVWAFPPSPPSWLCRKKKKDVMSKDGCETTYSPAGGLLVNHKSLAVGCVLSCHRWSFILKRSMINIYKIDLFVYLMWPTTCDRAHQFLERCLKVNTENHKRPSSQPQLSTAAFRWSSCLSFLHTGFIFWPAVCGSPFYTICGQRELARRELGS